MHLAGLRSVLINETALPKIVLSIDQCWISGSQDQIPFMTVLALVNCLSGFYPHCLQPLEPSAHSSPMRA